MCSATSTARSLASSAPHGGLARPYRIVVLSDHGQTQGATFDERYDQSLADLVGQLCGEVRDADTDSEEGRTESSAWFRSARGRDKDPHASEAKPTVLASGNLGLIYLPEGDRRLTVEEIEQSPSEAAVLGYSNTLASGSCRCSRPTTARWCSGRRVAGTSTAARSRATTRCAPFGPGAIEMVAKAAGYSNAADVMVNSLYDVERDEVAAFEHQVSSHGGLGGAQTHPFVLHPADLDSAGRHHRGAGRTPRRAQGLVGRPWPTGWERMA